VGSSAPE
jgi:hypothetical protein